MSGGNGFMSDISHEDVLKIFNKLDEIEKDISDIKLSQQETAGRANSNQEINELKMKHMEETSKLREEKHEAQISLINEQVQLNKDSIAGLFTKNLQSEKIGVQVKIVFAIIGILSIPIIYGIIQIILIWGKVKGF